MLGEVGSSLVESFIRRNPRIIKSIPGGEALAGLLDSDNKEREADGQTEGKEEMEVSFQPKGNGSASKSDDDQIAITFMNQLKAQFIEAEFDKVLLILQTLAADKGKIDLILNHINIKQQGV